MAYYKIKKLKGATPTALRENYFQSYEEARSALRKWLRKRANKGYANAIFSMNNYGNASIHTAGFTIRKV